MERILEWRVYHNKKNNIIQEQYRCQWKDSILTRTELQALKLNNQVKSRTELPLPKIFMKRSIRLPPPGHRQWNSSTTALPDRDEIINSDTTSEKRYSVAWKAHWCHLNDEDKRRHASALNDFKTNPLGKTAPAKTPECRYDLHPWPMNLSATVSIDYAEHHPEWDIVAPTNRKPSMSAQDDHVYFHRGDGTFAGRIKLASAKDLWKRYTIATPDANKDNFCIRMCRDFALKRHGRETNVDGEKINTTTQWSLPHRVTDAIRNEFSTTREMISCPLTVNPGTTEYWTAHLTDADFGAKHNGYSILSWVPKGGYFHFSFR
jgi:hypothetical protein